MTNELVNPVLASTAVLARITRAFVDVAQTTSIVITPGTFAPEIVHQIYTTTTVGARIARAFVDVGLAMLSGETRFALARISTR